MDLNKFLFESKNLEEPFSKTTQTLIREFCKDSNNGASFCSAGLATITDQLKSAASKAAELTGSSCADVQLEAAIAQEEVLRQQAHKAKKQRHSLQRKLDKAKEEENTSLSESLETQLSSIAMQENEIKKQLHVAKKQRKEREKQLTELKTKDAESLTLFRVTTEKLTLLHGLESFYNEQCTALRDISSKLASKLQSHSLSMLSVEDTSELLKELEFPLCHISAFKENEIDGPALELMNETNMRELGISDIKQRKCLVHAICNIHFHGSPQVGSGMSQAASWPPEKAFKWLEDHGFGLAVLRGMPGYVLIHLTVWDIKSLGIPFGKAIKIAHECKLLREACFGIFYR